MKKGNRNFSLLIMAIAYTAGMFTGFFTGRYFHAIVTHPLPTVFFADLACMVVVFVFTSNAPAYAKTMQEVPRWLPFFPARRSVEKTDSSVR